MNPLIVSKNEASKMMKTSPNRMLELLESGEISAYKDKDVWRVPVKSLEDYIERRLADAK